MKVNKNLIARICKSGSEASSAGAVHGFQRFAV